MKKQQHNASTASRASQNRGYIVLAVIALWALLYLPNLRTNPNWYGDEGEWMEKCWTFIHGTPRVGPIVNDFVFPYSYPPLYMLVTGSLLRLFGEDLVVARAIGAVSALAAGCLLYWIGSRVRDRWFGLIAALSFLCYSEAVINFRWVRSHPMTGVLALASVGFLVRYVQEKRLRDIALAGLMCSLATATHYMAYPLIGGVILTAAVVNWRSWKTSGFWQHLVVAGVTASGYAMLFVLWYVTTQGGWDVLMAQVGRLTSVAGNEVRPTVTGEVARFVKNVWTLGFKTPTEGPPSWGGRDWWLVMATLGFAFLPVRDWRFRVWLPVWLLILMYGVFKKLNNVPMFFYPATVFLPLMSLGVAGLVTWAGEGLVKWLKAEKLRWAPAIVVIGLFAVNSISGAMGHFDTKIDVWTQQSVVEAEKAMAYVNARTTADDLVIVPKQIYWLVHPARRSMLTFCARYKGVDNDMPVPVHIPEEMYWFDPRIEQAKYVVIASGIDSQARSGRGFDLVYASGLRGVPAVVETLLRAKWPVVFAGGRGATLIPISPGEPRWPVAVDGEYLVFGNPKWVKPEEVSQQ